MAARRGERANRVAFDRMMASGDSCYSPVYHGPAAGEVAKKYPAAAAYLRAEAFCGAAHDQKVSAGQRAVARLEAGEDYIIVMREMDAEWLAAAEKSVWAS